MFKTIFYHIPKLCYFTVKHGGRAIQDSELGKSKEEIFEHVHGFANDNLDMFNVKVNLDYERMIDPPAIICSNHVSLFDSLAIISLPRIQYFAAKKELFKIPYFGKAIEAIGMPMIDRSNTRQAIASMNAAADHIKDVGAYLVVYVEGTRSDSYQQLDYEKGAFKLSMNSGLPIVPLSVYGGLEIHKKWDMDVKPGEMHVKVHDPIYPNDNLEAMVKNTYDVIQKGIYKLSSS